MAEKTGISWCDATFNPWWGCQKVSPACDHCYAERDAKRFEPGRVLWGVGSERRTFDDQHWNMPLKWARAIWYECLDCGNRYSSSSKANRRSEFATCGHCGSERAKVSRRRVFCASMGDWLDLDAPLDEFVRLLDTIRRTPELDWLLLTKRIGNWKPRLFGAQTHMLSQPHPDPTLTRWVAGWLMGTPPANAWLGATVINQDEADRDINKLLAVPARVRFVSIEPMLGQVNLRVKCPPEFQPWLRADRVGWVICGGESGPHARPLHVEWVRSIVQQCKAAGVAVHVKQLGARPEFNGISDDASRWPPSVTFGGDTGHGTFQVNLAHQKGGDVNEWPRDLRVQEFPS
jgi:protein gp37